MLLRMGRTTLYADRVDRACTFTIRTDQVCGPAGEILCGNKKLKWCMYICMYYDYPASSAGFTEA